MHQRLSVLRRTFGALIGCLILLVPCVASGAEGDKASRAGAEALVDPYPLRPPDTSSPRATLQSLLHDADYVINAWRKGDLDERGYRNFINAVDTLDFSTTPGSESFAVKIERVILLKELLDRIELPRAAEIPDATEVAAKGVTQWTIPNTRLTIARVADGPRAGQFVFSAATVERLDAFYRLAKDLPYKRSATTPGAYEQFVLFRGPGEDPLRDRLKQIDASSPRATLVGFLDSLNEAYALVQDTNARLKAGQPPMTEREIRQVESRVRNLVGRAVNLLDVSQLPAAYRSDYGFEAALQLKEVLDRTLLPFLEAIPDAEMVSAARRRAGAASTPATEGFRWRYPGTEIEIVEMTQGERRGQFLFSVDSVRRAGEFYRKVRDLPYRSELGESGRTRFDWTGESKGVYDYFISSPGYVLPEAHFVGRIVDWLPAPFKRLYGEQTLWQWIGLVLCALVAAAIGFLVFRLTERAASPLKSPLNAWVMLVAPILSAFVVSQALRIVDTAINITGGTFQLVTAIAQATIAFLAVWAVIRLAHAIAETLIALPQIREGTHDASLVRIGARTLALITGALIIIYSLRNLGADMVPLLAGLGVGGLAVALAAQRTFANFIGSLILYINKPVKIGDFCRYGDQVGTVEQIGVLATRIRSLERTIVTVPNAEFSEMKIDNFAVRDQRLLKTILQLRYETTPEQMRFILAKLRALLLGHPKVTPSPARVRFVGYGPYSKDLEVFAYLDCADQDTFLAIQEDILLRMEDIVNEAGSGFAFPSQTAYLTRDKGLDARRQGAAEVEVGRWRRGGRLPFPEFESEERHRMEDVLDYPPRGSPDYESPRTAPGTAARPAGPALSADDLADLPGLAARLRGKERVAEYLRERFSDGTRELLAAYDGGRDVELRDALVRDINEIIVGDSIYDERRFADVALREDTRALLAVNPQGEDLARLNRLLLDDAFVGAMAINAESP